MEHEFFGQQWHPSLEYCVAFAAWCAYFYECESYDRRVCSVQKEDGTALPLDGHEAWLINNHALQRRKEIIQLLSDWNISKSDSDNAKEEAGRLSFEATKIESLRLNARIEDLGSKTHDSDSTNPDDTVT
jgi:hypothetical protein